MDPHPAIDHQELSERLGADDELINEILELFAQESDGMFSSVADALASADIEALERAAHTLKGALLNIAARPAAAVASELEALGHAGTLDGAEGCVERLRTELDRLLHQLQAASV